MTDFPQPDHAVRDCSLYVGDCMEVLRTLPGDSVQCVVTSPPYWGLRDYGTGAWDGGDAGCEHRRSGPLDDSAATPRDGHCRGFRHGKGDTDHANEPYADTCPKCGARRIDKQLGLEATPDEYLAKLVEIFREVRRVMRPDATLWLNMGDCYASSGTRRHGGWNGDCYDGGNNPQRTIGEAMGAPMDLSTSGLKPKDLVGMPWRLALALQADGWWLRSDIIWSKPNPMPESCTDRPTKAHEYVFLLTKQPRYFYDAEAVREDGPTYTRRAGGYDRHHEQGASRFGGKGGFGDSDVTTTGRNRRTVWEIPTQAYSKAHFATFPERLVEPCIMAGTSDKGACPECGAPWRRVVEREQLTRERPNDRTNRHAQGDGVSSCGNTVAGVSVRTIGWEPGCGCIQKLNLGTTRSDVKVAEPTDATFIERIPCTVLDPFMGSGTVGLVSRKLGRRFVGIELNEAYALMARERIANPENLKSVADVPGQMRMFAEDNVPCTTRSNTCSL